MIDISNKTVDKKQQQLNRINFYKFFSEHDRRRQTRFLEVFPELKDFWKECKKMSEQYDKEQRIKH